MQIYVYLMTASPVEILILTVWGRACYLSFEETPRNTESLWGGEAETLFYNMNSRSRIEPDESDVTGIVCS